MNTRKRSFPTENNMDVCNYDDRRPVADKKRFFGQLNSNSPWNSHRSYIEYMPEFNVNHCFKCSKFITDQYVYKIHPGLKIHKKCLKCEECGKFLDEDMTCFFQASKVYCTNDYARLFVNKCLKCQRSFQPDDSVMRFNARAFHCECFKCDVCLRSITEGEEFMWHNGKLKCRSDFDEQKIDNKDIVKLNIDESKNASSVSSSDTRPKNDTDNSSNQPKKPKTTRVRTVLNEKQLQTLRSCYNTNPRPDALVKEQLCELTGLTPRVIRVWFQNKRCKDKKRSLMLKQLQEQERLREISRAVVPMIAASPITTNDLSGHMGPVDITPYQNHHWKQMPNNAYSIQSTAHDLSNIVVRPTTAYDSQYYQANQPNTISAHAHDANVSSYAGMYISEQAQNCNYDELTNNAQLR